MTSREATIYHLKKLKGQPLRMQLQYILSNFWIPIVAVLAAIIFLSSLIVHWATQTSSALTLCCINTIADDAATDSYLQGFAEARGIDTKKHTFDVERMYFGNDAETDYQYFQMFSVMQMAGDLDVLIAEYETITDYAYQSYFSDLTGVLTEEQLDQLAPHFLYIDLSLLEKIDPYAEKPPAYPNPTRSEEMEQPIPVAIKLQPDWGFTKSCYPYTYQKNAVALFVNSRNASNAKVFLQYILTYEGN